jgi:hypothetical protein
MPATPELDDAENAALVALKRTGLATAMTACAFRPLVGI